VSKHISNGYLEPHERDGRNINPAIGTLSGEGSEQRVTRSIAGGEAEGHGVLELRDHERPVIKKSVWSWSIPAYYYVGGATGAGMALGAAATLLDRDELSDLILRSRIIGVTGSALSAGLLIYDLGRPSRFLHMLRIFRPTSPMSMGSWILTSFSGFSTLAMVVELGPARFWGLGDTAALAAGFLGLGLSGYTGVLLAQTAVPIWQRPHRFLPALFMASGVTAAAALFEIVGGRPREEPVILIFGTAGKLAELGCAHFLEKSVATVPEAGRPFQEGFSGFAWKAAKILMAGSLILSLVSRRSPRLRRISGVLGTLGSLCTRFGVHYAGQQSAMNPRATFHQQRKGQGSVEITGRAAVTGPGGERAVRVD
jgi:formate-dependent nitrite reductase membrane component NrfD